MPAGAGWTPLTQAPPPPHPPPHPPPIFSLVAGPRLEGGARVPGQGRPHPGRPAAQGGHAGGRARAALVCGGARAAALPGHRRQVSVCAGARAGRGARGAAPAARGYWPGCLHCLWLIKAFELCSSLAGTPSALAALARHLPCPTASLLFAAHPHPAPHPHPPQLLPAVHRPAHPARGRGRGATQRAGRLPRAAGRLLGLLALPRWARWRRCRSMPGTTFVHPPRPHPPGSAHATRSHGPCHGPVRSPKPLGCEEHARRHAR